MINARRVSLSLLGGVSELAVLADEMRQAGDAGGEVSDLDRVALHQIADALNVCQVAVARAVAAAGAAKTARKQARRR